MLRSLASDLWVVERPLRFLGIEVGCRMTVLRLSGGRLAVHSRGPLRPGAPGRGLRPLEKLLIRDRRAFRASLDRVLAWPFDRVVVSHGAIVESGGREALARGYEGL